MKEQGSLTASRNNSSTIMGSSNENGIIGKIKSFDFYKKLPQQISEPTMSGALVSIICSVVMILLFISQFNQYRDIKTQSEMFIDKNRGDQRLNVNIDIDLLKYPCQLVSIDLVDKLGTHILNFSQNLEMTSMNAQGGILWKGKMESNQRPKFKTSSDAISEIEKGRKCHIKGSILVYKVPGNIHISSHAFNIIISDLQSLNSLKLLNLSHRINHLSFGDNQDYEMIQKSFNVGQLNPLDNIQLSSDASGSNSYAYYLKAVPTTYKEKNKESQYYFHQFTSNHQEFYSAYSPLIQFDYELSPVTVKYSKLQKSLASFLIQICAIIGGIFTVSGIIDAFVYSTMSKIFKERIGKQN